MVESVPFLVHEHLEGVAGLERPVKVEEHEAVFAAVLVLEALDVVLRPVPVSEVELCSHVVDVFVDVEHPLDFLIHLAACGIGRELVHEFEERLLRSAFLHVARVRRHLKLVDFLVVPSVVGIDIMLVVGFPDIEHADILAVDELMHGLVALHIDVYSRRLHDVLQSRVQEAAHVVVATIPHLQRPVPDVWLVLKELVVEVFVSSQFLVAFQFESVGVPSPAPSTAHLEVDVLVEHHLPLSVEV